MSHPIDDAARIRIQSLDLQQQAEDMLDSTVTGITNFDEDYLTALSTRDFAAAFVIADLALRRLGMETMSVRSVIWSSRARDMRVALGVMNDEQGC